MSDAAPVRRMFPGYTLAQLKQMLPACTEYATKAKMYEEIGRREAGLSVPFAVPQVGAMLQRKAAEPLKPAKAQDFDTSGLPLFGDAKNQGELF